MSEARLWIWNPVINWTTPAGRLLDQLVGGLPVAGHFEIVVFGSSSLQLGFEPSFVSADVDIFSDDDFTEVLRELQIDKGSATFYIEQVPQSMFLVAPIWRSRAHVESRGPVTFVFPHPLDILVSKIKRLAEKDLHAFELVKAKTGHPTAEELIIALRAVVDIYRPDFDEERSGGDAWANTQTVFRELFGREIDVRAEIIRPVVEERKSHSSVPPHKANLRRLTEQSGHSDS